MSTLFNPISQQAAVADLAELPRRIKAKTNIIRSGPEGRHVREQARQQLRWHRLFCTMGRREQV